MTCLQKVHPNTPTTPLEHFLDQHLTEIHGEIVVTSESHRTDRMKSLEIIHHYYTYFILCTKCKLPDINYKEQSRDGIGIRSNI